MDKIQESLIEDIYQAAFTPSLWESLLPNLASYFESNLGTLMRQDSVSGNSDFQIGWGIGEKELADYANYYGPRSVLFQDARHQKQGMVFTDTMSQNYDAYLRSETYNDYMRPLKADHLIQLYPSKSEDELAVILFRRDKKRGVYVTEECQRLHFLAPHLCRSFQIMYHLRDAETVESIFECSLNNLRHGCVLLDKDCKISFMNRKAEEMFALNDGLMLEDKHVTAVRPEEVRKLGEFIHILADSQTFLCNDNRVLEISISRPSGKKPFWVFAAPIAKRLIDELDNRPRYILFICDHSDDSQLSLTKLNSIYGMTDTEILIVKGLLSGQSTKTLASGLKMKESTLRWHMKNIYQKCDAVGQSDLMRTFWGIDLHLND